MRQSRQSAITSGMVCNLEKLINDFNSYSVR